MEGVEEVRMSKWRQLITLLDRKQRRAGREVGRTKEGLWGAEVNRHERL